MRIFSFILFLLISLKTSAQKSAINNCREKWQYLKLTDTSYGEVICHSDSGNAPCGNVGFVYMTIVKLNNLDTIRVLELCYALEDLSLHSKVKIIPQDIPFDYGLLLTSIDSIKDKILCLPEFYYCRPYKTYYGRIKKINQ